MKPKYYTEDIFHLLKPYSKPSVNYCLTYTTVLTITETFEHFERRYTLCTQKCDQIMTLSHQISLSHLNQYTTILFTPSVSLTLFNYDPASNLSTFKRLNFKNSSETLSDNSQPKIALKYNKIYPIPDAVGYTHIHIREEHDYDLG